MAETTIVSARFVLRNDTIKNWNAANSQVLLSGEVAIEFQTDGSVKMKIGDGTTTYKNLAYFTGAVADDGSIEVDGDVYSLKGFTDAAENTVAVKTYDSEGNGVLTWTPLSSLIVSGGDTSSGSTTDTTELQTQITNLTTRITAAEASISTVLTEAKTYTDEQIASVTVGSVDLTGYATETYADTAATAALNEAKAYVDTEIGNIDLTGVDVNLDGYAKTEDVDTALSEAKAYTDEKIASINTGSGSVDLTGYATETYVGEQVSEAKTELESSISSNLTEAKSYTDEQISSAKTEATTYTDSQVAEAKTYADSAASDAVSTANAYTDSQVAAVASGGSIDLSSYATVTYVDEKVAAAGSNVDLTGYATETYVAEQVDATKTELQTADATNLTEAKDYTDSQITSAKSELTTADDTVLTTAKEYTDEQITAAKTYADTVSTTALNDAKAYTDAQVTAAVAGGEIDLSGYSTVSYVDTTAATTLASAKEYADEKISAAEITPDKVILQSDITLAGDYTSIGNISKGSATGTATYSAKGKTLEEFLTELLSKELQPEITTAVSGTLTLSSAGAKEVGSTFTPSYSITFNNGAYTYDDDTGVTVTSYTVTDTNGKTASTASGSLTSFTVDDSTSYKVTATVAYSEGNVAKTNLGNDSNPVVQIAAGSLSLTSSSVTGYRSMFIYAGTDMSELTGSWIRSAATNKGNSTAPGSITIAEGTTRVVIAIPASKGKTLKSVIDVNGMGLDVASNFTETTIAIAGANSYTAADYDVWYYENENGLSATTYTVTMA